MRDGKASLLLFLNWLVSTFSSLLRLIPAYRVNRTKLFVCKNQYDYLCPY